MDGFRVDPSLLPMILVALLIGVTVHEFAHAFVALQLGDDTAARAGRVTFNPLAHFDPLGGFMLIMVALGSAPIGWGKPVPINPYRIRGGRRGMAWSSLAGPASNLLLATLFALPLHVLPADSMSYDLHRFLRVMIFMNASLAAFNLVPLPPLDGFNTFIGLLPNPWVSVLEPLRHPATIVFMLLLIVPWLAQQAGLYGGINVLATMVGPIQSLLLEGLIPSSDILSTMVGPMHEFALRGMLPVGGCCSCVGDCADA